MNLTNNVHSSTLTQAQSTSSKAPEQTSVGCLYNNHQGAHGTEIEKSLAHALQNHDASTNKAREEIDKRNITVAPHIKDGGTTTRKRGVATHLPSMAAVNFRVNDSRVSDYRQRTDTAKRPDRNLAQQATYQMHRDNALKQLSKEINALNLSSGDPSTLFLRGNSEGAKQVGLALKGVFKEILPGIVSKLNEEFSVSLNKLGANPSNEELGQALISTYEKLLECLKDVKFPPQFNEIANEINESLNRSASTQSKNANKDTNRIIQSNLNNCKKNIASALLLRSFCAELTTKLSLEESTDFTKAMSGYSKYHSGIKLHQIVSTLTSKINKSTSGTKRSAMQDAFPNFDDFSKSPKNNLSGFHALNEMNTKFLAS